MGDQQNHGPTAALPELEGGGYQVAPITSLALARWSWAAAGLVVGVLLGWLAVSATGGYRGTAVVQIRAGTLSSAGSGGGESAAAPSAVAALATSDAVLKKAVQALRGGTTLAGLYRTYGGRLPAPQGAAKDDEAPAQHYLEGGVTTATPVGATSVVEITVTRDGVAAQVPVIEANAIATAVRDQVVADADDQIKALRAELDKQVAGATPAEATRLQEYYATKVSQLAFDDKQSLTVIPTWTPHWAGGDPKVSGLLGGAGGTFVGALLAVAAGAGRRRPRSARELLALAPDLTVRSTARAGELAGRLLETGRRTAVVLALPGAGFHAAQFAMAVAHHVRTHGATVAVVDRIGESGGPAEERLWALRRDVRRDVPGNFAADVLVVDCPADEEALSLVAGQSDLLVVVVAKRRRSTLRQVRSAVEAVRVSEPVVVLTD